MQVITRNARQAFITGGDYHNTNTDVHTSKITGESSLRLWGNLIAWTSNNRTRLNITMAGWDTRTTADRLRALGVDIYHKRGELYINGRPATSDEIIDLPMAGTI